jgi:glycosyltransferase involved in cell wall biosynthesis
MLAAERPKVLLLIPHLGGGGAEQVMTLLAERLNDAKYEVHLGLVTRQPDGAEKLPAGVRVHTLGAGRVRAGAWRLLGLIWRLKPRIILSGMYHLNFLVLLLRPIFPAGTRVLVRQNGSVSAALKFGGQAVYTRLFYRILYRRADRVLCQSAAMAEDLAVQFGIDRKRLAVVPNPVDVEAIRDSLHTKQAHWNCPGPHLLAVGRLSREKGFDLLLQALSLVRARFSTVDLLVVGGGAEEANLKAECRRLGLDEAVRFVGHRDCPWAYFAGATLFVLSSRHEGLPNALLEAAAVGLPLVATPASGGIEELLRSQPGAWLAKEISAEALATALLGALQSLRHEERFEHSFINAYKVNDAIEEYEKVIDTVLQEKPR